MGNLQQRSKKEQMCNAVIQFVVSQGDNIRPQDIHNLYGGDSLEFRIYKRASEHVPCDHVKGIGGISPDLVYITRKQGDTSHQLIINFFCQKIAVHVIGMQERKMF